MFRLINSNPLNHRHSSLACRSSRRATEREFQRRRRRERRGTSSFQIMLSHQRRPIESTTTTSVPKRKKRMKIPSPNELLEIKEEDEHFLSPNLFDENQFWSRTPSSPSTFYQPVQSSSSSTQPLSTASDVESSNSPKPQSNQSRKDKSLGLLCQR